MGLQNWAIAKAFNLLLAELAVLIWCRSSKVWGLEGGEMHGRNATNIQDTGLQNMQLHGLL